MLDTRVKRCYTVFMDKLLKNVARATKRRDEVCAQSFAAYVNAIRVAREAGHTLEAIGQHAGISKNGVRYLLHPDPRKEQADGSAH